MSRSPIPCQADGPAADLFRIATRVASLAQNGLAYTEGHFDRDRYAQLQQLAAELLALQTDRPVAEFLMPMQNETGYSTPKIDVRGVVFDEADRVLLMREFSDGLWSVPGGWADAGDAPAEAVVRELAEETGYPTRPVKLIACWDRDHQGHVPPFPFHVYKLFFLCVVTGPPSAPSELETLDLGWFPLDGLPELSRSRVSVEQLHAALRHHHDRSLPTEFD